jgi:hypothetical protein
MRIVQVVNAMISASAKITDVTRNDKEYFFMYDGKYRWSIIKDSNGSDYYLHFYPTFTVSTAQMANIEDWSEYEFITYRTEELKTKEAYESFSELYQIVAEKVFGVDDIFDNILKGS